MEEVTMVQCKESSYQIAEGYKTNDTQWNN